MRASPSRGRWPGILLAAALFLAWAPVPAHAFGIAPRTSSLASDNPLEAILNFISRAEGDAVEVGIKAMQRPVHEEITKIAYYAALGRGPDRSVLDGVEWNDNPPFRLFPSQYPIAPMCATLPIHLPSAWPGCWMMVFGTTSRVSAPPGDAASFGPEAPILARSHFGDMQFLHAMAIDGDAASITRQKILAWARFAYMVAQGETSLDLDLPKVELVDPESGFAWKPFPDTEGYSPMKVRDLFVLPEEQRKNDTGTDPNAARFLKDDHDARNIAFGSVLHIIEDSFSRAHVLRSRGELPADGRLSRRETPASVRIGFICEFHGYAHQDHMKHADSDLEEAFEDAQTEPFVIEAVIRMVVLRESGRQWDDTVRKTLAEEIFPLAPHPSPAGPGDYRAERLGAVDASGNEEGGRAPTPVQFTECDQPPAAPARAL